MNARTEKSAIRAIIGSSVPWQVRAMAVSNAARGEVVRPRNHDHLGRAETSRSPADAKPLAAAAAAACSTMVKHSWNTSFRDRYNFR